MTPDQAPTGQTGATSGTVLRVTVTDVLTGDTETAEIPAGDYLILCTDPCYLAGAQTYPKSGTHVLTIKGRTRP